MPQIPHPREREFTWRLISADDRSLAKSAHTFAGNPAVKVPGVVKQPVAGVRRTPALAAPAVGALRLTILISGAAARSSPVLESLVVHGLGAALRRSVRKGVMPTEQ